MNKRVHNDDYIKSLFEMVDKCISEYAADGISHKIKKTYLRLLSDNGDTEKCIDLIVGVLVSEMLFIMKSNKDDFVNKRFSNNLDNLPNVPTIEA